MLGYKNALFNLDFFGPNKLFLGQMVQLTGPFISITRFRTTKPRIGLMWRNNEAKKDQKSLK